MKIFDVLKSYPRTFWVANNIELLERWAYYGFFMLFANYIVGSTDEGGLGLSQEQKGIIMGFGTAILYFLPVITGSIADKFGYKNVLYIAFTIYASSFFTFPYFHSFLGVFIVYLYLAVGAALFKPVISATIAKTTNDSNSSVGFGIFYMMVNIGAFFGPMTTLFFKGTNYDIVFQLSAGIILLNFILLFFYQEPGRVKSEQPLSKMISHVFKQIFNVLSDFKFLLFLIIVAGFWTMYYQLFFTLPVFINEWVDTSGLYHFFSQNLPFIAEHYGHDGEMDAEFLTNFDALYIVIFQIIISSIVMRLKPLTAMTSGFIVNAIGMALTFYTQNVTFFLVALLIFGIGEMMGSPKITEYIAKIAPSDKKALYMGFSYIPVFLGSSLAGIVSGNVYGAMSDKHQLTMKLASQNNFTIASDLTKNEYFAAVAQQMNMTNHELTNYLWSSFHPNHFWYVVFGIGFGAAILLLLYNQFIVKKSS